MGAGRIPGAGFAVVAMGKLGGREMTASSDLDLVFVVQALLQRRLRSGTSSDTDRESAFPCDDCDRSRRR